MRDVEVDVQLLGRVLLGRGLKYQSGLAGRAYDLRPVRRAQAGSWLVAVLEAYEERTSRKAQRFALNGSDLLILD